MAGTYHLEGIPKRGKFWHLEAVALEMRDRLSGGPKVGAEVGCYLCWFSAELMSRFPNLSMRLVDPYPMDTTIWHKSLAKSKLDYDPENMRLVKEAAIKRMLPFGNRAAWHFLPSHEAVKLIEPESLDFVFIDASHDYTDCKRDLVDWWKVVKPGGTCSGHDYVPHRSPRHRWGVTRAVHEFRDEMGVDFVRGDGKTFFFHKPADWSQAHADLGAK